MCSKCTFLFLKPPITAVSIILSSPISEKTMSLKQSKIQKSTALFDEDWLRSNARGAQTSSKGLQVKWRGSGGNSPSSPSAGRISTLGKHYAVIRVGKIKGMAKLSAAASHNSHNPMRPAHSIPASFQCRPSRSSCSPFRIAPIIS